MSDARVLDYGDVLLRRCDVELLEGPEWLNDQIIGFYFEWLYTEAFPRIGIVMVPGSSTFLIANLGPGAAGAVLDPLGFSRAQLALFAVNNNPDVEAAGGGSHWSLLAYSAADGAWRHYDSLSGTNRSAARRVYEAARQPGAPLLVEQATPQQANGYDCGLYVLALARLLCQRHAQQGCSMSFDVAASEVTPPHAAALRQEVLALIRSKAAAAAGS